MKITLQPLNLTQNSTTETEIEKKITKRNERKQKEIKMYISSKIKCKKYGRVLATKILEFKQAQGIRQR